MSRQCSTAPAGWPPAPGRRWCRSRSAAPPGRRGARRRFRPRVYMLVGEPFTVPAGAGRERRRSRPPRRWCGPGCCRALVAVAGRADRSAEQASTEGDSDGDRRRRSRDSVRNGSRRASGDGGAGPTSRNSAGGRTAARRRARRRRRRPGAGGGRRRAAERRQVHPGQPDDRAPRGGGPGHSRGHPRSGRPTTRCGTGAASPSSTPAAGSRRRRLCRSRSPRRPSGR